MSLVSRLLVAFGLISLIHAAYSAHEFATINARLRGSTALPLDIKLETLISVTLACLGLVMGSASLKPISWSTWAGNIEREGKVNPFMALEERASFVDIRQKRKEFADWVRNQGDEPEEM